MKLLKNVKSSSGLYVCNSLSSKTGTIVTFKLWKQTLIA